eukprot:scaffold64620_cov29-Tisochrysis_lutea.AAC.3
MLTIQAHAEAKRRARAAERKARAVERRAAKLREKEEAERRVKEAGDAEDSSVASGKRCNGGPETDAKRKSGTKSASKTDGSKHSESDSDEEADTAFYDLLQVHANPRLATNVPRRATCIRLIHLDACTFLRSILLAEGVA